MSFASVSQPAVRLRLPDGRVVLVPAGGLIGRLITASCRIIDPRVSEVHALVSLRGRSLRLLTMRSPIRVDGDLVRELTLEDGQRLYFADDLVVEVDSVILPTRVLAVVLPDGEHAELSAQVHSVLPGPVVVPGAWPEALAHIWSHGEGWSLVSPSGIAEDLRAGRSYTVGAHNLGVQLVPVESVAVPATLRPDWTDIPLRLVLRLDTVHIFPGSQSAVTVDGLSGRLLSELGNAGYPMHWSTLAARLWPEKASRGFDLRMDWDPLLRRLLHKLRDHGIRENLVRKAGHGNVELFLNPGDTVEDLS